VQEQKATVAKLLKDVEAAPKIAESEKPLACPHCNKPFKLTHAASGRLVPSAQAPTMTLDQIREANLRHQTAVDAYRWAQRRLDELVTELDLIEKDLDRARDAAARMAHLKVDDENTRAARAAAKERVASLELVLEAVQQMHSAAKVFSEWEALQPMLKALAPDGVRKQAAQRAISTFNDALAVFTGAAGIAPVEMTEDYGLTLGGRPYSLCSESEQWRIDAMVTLALAKQERAPFAALDRLDLIVPDERGGIMRAALKAETPVVVACTVQECSPERLPGLKRMNAGRVCWLEGGALKMTDL
jgi:hypothetical protein